MLEGIPCGIGFRVFVDIELVMSQLTSNSIYGVTKNIHEIFFSMNSAAAQPTSVQCDNNKALHTCLQGASEENIPFTPTLYSDLVGM
jgi:hypothetical protein